MFNKKKKQEKKSKQKNELKKDIIKNLNIVYFQAAIYLNRKSAAFFIFRNCRHSMTSIF